MENIDGNRNHILLFRDQDQKTQKSRALAASLVHPHRSSSPFKKRASVITQNSPPPTASNTSPKKAFSKKKEPKKECPGCRKLLGKSDFNRINFCDYDGPCNGCINSLRVQFKGVKVIRCVKCKEATAKERLGFLELIVRANHGKLMCKRCRDREPVECFLCGQAKHKRLFNEAFLFQEDPRRVCLACEHPTYSSATSDVVGITNVKLCSECGVVRARPHFSDREWYLSPTWSNLRRLCKACEKSDNFKLLSTFPVCCECGCMVERCTSIRPAILRCQQCLQQARERYKTLPLESKAYFRKINPLLNICVTCGVAGFAMFSHKQKFGRCDGCLQQDIDITGAIHMTDAHQKEMEARKMCSKCLDTDPQNFSYEEWGRDACEPRFCLSCVSGGESITLSDGDGGGEDEKLGSSVVEEEDRGLINAQKLCVMPGCLAGADPECIVQCCAAHCISCSTHQCSENGCFARIVTNCRWKECPPVAHCLSGYCFRHHCSASTCSCHSHERLQPRFEKKKQLEAEERANMSDWELKLIRVIPLLDACQSRRNSISSDAYLLGDEVDLKFHFGMNASVGWSNWNMRGRTPLELAISSGNLLMVHMIMEKIMRVTNAVGRMQSSVSGKHYGRECLHIAAKNNDLGLAWVLLEKGKMAVGAPDYDGLHAIHHARSEKLVRLLLSFKSEIDSHVAVPVEYGGAQVVSLSYLSDPLLERPAGMTALHLAIIRGDVDMVRVLLRFGADVKAETLACENVAILLCRTTLNDQCIAIIQRRLSELENG